MTSVIGFGVITFLLVTGWPPPARYTPVSHGIVGCYSLDQVGRIEVTANSVRVDVGGLPKAAAAREGEDKSGKYLLTTPGLVLSRSGEKFTLGLTDTAKSFRATGSELSTYAADGNLIRFQKSSC